MRKRGLSIIGFALFALIVYVGVVHAGLLPAPF